MTDQPNLDHTALVEVELPIRAWTTISACLAVVAENGWDKNANPNAADVLAALTDQVTFAIELGAGR